MDIKDFDYKLPEELIAQTPAEKFGKIHRLFPFWEDASPLLIIIIILI